MTDQPTPINTPRSPMATGTPEQKARFDLLTKILQIGPIQPLSCDDIMRMSGWGMTGDDVEFEEDE